MDQIHIIVHNLVDRFCGRLSHQTMGDPYDQRESNDNARERLRGNLIHRKHGYGFRYAE